MTKLLTKEITIAEAEQRTEQHKADFARLEVGWIEFCRDIEESKRLGVPRKLGRTLRQWLAENFNYSASYIFDQMQTYRKLNGIPESTLQAIPLASAHELTRLNEKDRKDPEIVQKAVDQAPREFKETVAQIRASKYGITPDKWKTFVVRVPMDVYDALIAAQDKMATVLNVDLSDDEHRAARLVTVWEAVAVLVNGSDESRLKTEIEGLA